MAILPHGAADVSDLPVARGRGDPLHMIAMTGKAGEATKRGDKAPELVVVSALKSWTCAECSGTGSLLTMDDAGLSA